MSKIKVVIGLFAYLAIGLFMTQSAQASVLAIQTLPSYINTNNFKLSCTSSGGAVQFSASKHGGAFTDFGPSINTDLDPCIVQVDSSVVNDQTDYIFSVGGYTTSTFYDISEPSPVSGYYKERISDGAYKIHWTNPGDTDFDKVVIYKGDAQGFSADSGHEIARVSGGSNSAMTYEDHFTPDAGKTYFYAIRALDHAGNSSSLAGNEGTTTQVLGTSASSTGKVTVLPKEKGIGSILGTEATPTASPETLSPDLNTKPGVAKWVLTHKKASLAIVFALFVVAYGFYFYSKKNK